MRKMGKLKDRQSAARMDARKARHDAKMESINAAAVAHGQANLAMRAAAYVSKRQRRDRYTMIAAYLLLLLGLGVFVYVKGGF